MKIEKEKIKELFEQKGYYISDYLLSKTCLGLFYISEGKSVGQEVFSMCLDGPSGAGKTFFVETYCKAASDILKKPVKFINFQLDAETGKSDLYEDIDVVATFEGDTSKIRIPGKIIEAFQAVNEGNYVVLKMDEYDKARDVTDTFFNNCLQEGLINTVQHGNIKIKPENRGMLQVFLCKNDIRTELSEPMMRRNRIVRLDYMTPERLFLVLSEFSEKHGCNNELLNLVTLLYEQLYQNRDTGIYQKLPSCSECEQAIMDAHVLMKIGDFTQNDIYINIIEDMLKMADDIETFESRINSSTSESGKKLASLIKNMKSEEVNQNPPSINSLIAESIFTKENQKLIQKTREMEQLIEEYKTRFEQMEQERKQAIRDEIEKIKLENGELVSTKNVPNAMSLFGDESSHIKRGHNIFELSSGDWTDVATIFKPHLSHSYFISKLMEHASNLDIKIYENGILLKEDGEQKLIIINDMDENNQPKFRILSSNPVIPSTFIPDIKNCISFMNECYTSQPKSAKAIAQQATGFNGKCSVDTIVYNDTPITDDSVGENIYHLLFDQELGKDTELDKFNSITSLIACQDTNKALEISKKIMSEQGKVFQK